MYNFRLEAVLKHRKSIEEALQKELSLLVRILEEERKKLKEFENTRNRFSKELKDKQVKSVTISETLLYVRYIEQVSKCLDSQKEKILNTEKDIDQKREDLCEAMKNRKALERLRERGFETYKYAMMKKEQSFINDMAAARFKNK